MPSTRNSHIIDDLMHPIGAKLTVDFAESIVSLKAKPAVQKRVSALAGKANEGRLTEDEKEEYRTYILAGKMIAYLQAEARVLLANS
jgi:hypothetical protein